METGIECALNKFKADASEGKNIIQKTSTSLKGGPMQIS